MRSLILFQVAPFPVAVGQAKSKGQKSKRRKEKDHYTLVDRSLAVLRSGNCGSVAHSASLAEGWRGPQEKGSSEDSETQFHRTPK